MCRAPEAEKVVGDSVGAVQKAFVVGSGSAGAIAALCMVSASHAYSLANFYSYAGFLAVDLHWAADLDSSGTVVGILGTCLPLARVPVSVPWGMAMDRFGRRPCLILTAVCLCIGQIIFPFCTSWVSAIIVRLTLLGMGNGWVVLMAVCCAELGGPERQGQLLGYVIGAGGVINLIGPGLGGYTYKLLGSTFPALLPCLVGAAIALTAASMVAALLPETRPPKRLTTTSTASNTSAADDISLSTALRTHPLPLLVLLRCLLGFAGFCKMTVIPLWAIASKPAGGLALNNQDVGLLLSSAAAFSLAYTTLFMAKVIKRCGARRAMLASALLQMLTLILLPCLQSAPFILIVIINAVLEVSNVTCFTCTIAAVNNVCSRFPHKRGAINGVNVTVESAAKAMGPALGGGLYAWTIARELPPNWPSASIVYFLGFAALLGVFTMGAVMLPTSIDTDAAKAAAALEMKPAKQTSPRVRLKGFRKLREEGEMTPGER